MDMSKIPTGENPPFDVNAIIEVPLGGQPIKYELDKASGAMFVDRFLYTAMRYPCMMMEDEAGMDEKIVAVPHQTLTRFYDNIKTYEDLPQILQDRIAHFFGHYKDLEEDKWVKVLGWKSAEIAGEMIMSGIKNYKG